MTTTMPDTILTRHPAPARRARRGGFSFAEVLFAVAVLGIGLIMISAIYPVAIQQTQISLEETVGASVARNAESFIEGNPLVRFEQYTPPPAGSPVGTPGVFSPPTFPPTSGGPPVTPGSRQVGRVFWFNDPRIPEPTRTNLWNSVRLNMISTADPRYAWIPFYSRTQGDVATEMGLAAVSFYFIAAASRTQADFTTDEDTNGIPDAVQNSAATALSELEPRPVKVKLTEGAPFGQPDLIQLNLVTTTDDPLLVPPVSSLESAVEGAYVIISDVADQAATPSLNESEANGRIYRLGRRRADLDGTDGQAWELAPGFDMAISPGPNGVPENGGGDDVTEELPPPAGSPNIALVVGRGYEARLTPGVFTGTNMAIQRYYYPTIIERPPDALVP